jgi:hypothetical protein
MLCLDGSVSPADTAVVPQHKKAGIMMMKLPIIAILAVLAGWPK